MWKTYKASPLHKSIENFFDLQTNSKFKRTANDNKNQNRTQQTLSFISTQQKSTNNMQKMQK